VARQATQLFDAFHLRAMRAFFTDGENIEEPALLRAIAKEVGADLARFDDDTSDPRLRQSVWEEFTGGVERYRVTAVPPMLLGEPRRIVEGALPLDRYRRLFRAALSGKDARTPPGE
jgi:predicted DsbA family dithiol-disulfide isomerase